MAESVQITNHRSLKLAGELHLPSSNAPRPAVILLHGFTGYKQEGHIVAMGEALAGAGIVAIRFDASGFADSEGTLEDDYRFSNYLQDAEDVLAWLGARDD